MISIGFYVFLSFLCRNFQNAGRESMGKIINFMSLSFYLFAQFYMVGSSHLFCFRFKLDRTGPIENEEGAATNTG